MKRGSIALARSICYEVAGPTDEDDDMTGSGYGSVDIAEILSSEVENLRAAICQTLDANSHLADGEVCTLLPLKVALRKSGAPWDGDELHNVQAHRLPERQSGGAAGSATLTEREEYMQLTEGTNDQLMAMAAMRYCLGRRSYIVGACHEWLREVWPQLTTNSQNVILRDIVEALRDDLAGDQLDMVGWTHTARWMWESMAADQRTWVQGAVGWRGIADVEAWLTVMPNVEVQRDSGSIIAGGSAGTPGWGCRTASADFWREDMSIHVCKCDHGGREEYHLRYPGMTEAAAQELADRINGGWLRPPEKPKGGLAEAVKLARGGDAPIPFKRW